MTRAVVVGGSLGGLTSALVLRDQGWEVEVLERTPVPLRGRGAGIVVHPTTVRYLVERAGVGLGDLGVPARALRYLDGAGAVAHEQPCAYRFASYFELYSGLLEAFGTDRYRLGAEVVGLDNRGDHAAVTLAGGRSLAAHLVVCADGIRSTGRRLLLPGVEPRYAGYVAWRGTISQAELSPGTAEVLRGAITYRILPGGHLLTYPIPSADSSTVCNWLWYRNVPPGNALNSLLTDTTGGRVELAVPPGSVQPSHLDDLRAAADRELPAPLAEVVGRTADPFIQVIVDVEVPRMAFGRICLLGDAAFVLRPHIAVGSAKAADDAWQLGNALLAAAPPDVPLRLKTWEAQQLPVAQRAMRRACAAGRSVQLEGTWVVGRPLPFGLHTEGDSAVPEPEGDHGRQEPVPIRVAATHTLGSEVRRS